MALTLGCVLCRKEGDASHFYCSIIVAKQIHNNNIIMKSVGVFLKKKLCLWWNEMLNFVVCVIQLNSLLLTWTTVAEWLQVVCWEVIAIDLCWKAKSTVSGKFYWTHICRSEGTSVAEAGCQSGSIRGGKVQDHSSRSVLHQALHSGPAQARRTACHQADHTLLNTHTHGQTGTEQGEEGSAGNKEKQ